MVVRQQRKTHVVPVELEALLDEAVHRRREHLLAADGVLPMPA